jgi:hypothetical protein
MYAVLVLLMVGVHALHGRRPHHPAEHLAGAVDMAVAGVVGGFTTAARAKAHEQLAKAGAEVPGSAETTALLAAIPDDKYELYDPVEHGAELFAAAQGELRDRAVTGRVAVLVLPVYAAIALASAAYLVVVEAGAGHVAVPGQGWVSVGGVALGSVLMSVLVVTGLRRLGRDRRAAFRRFQRAVLVSVLLTQVFGFAVQQLAACLAVGVDLLLFGAIGVELHRLRPRAAAPRPSP